MEGWVKLHRCLMEKSIWLQSTPEQKVILITLLTMANHKKKQWEWNGKKFEAAPGQFVTSAASIMLKSGSGISRQNVRSSLTRLEKYKFLTHESTKTGTLITIVNWHVYQGESSEGNQETNQSPTKGQPRVNQESTNAQPLTRMIRL